MRELGPERARRLLVPLLERWIDEGAEAVALMGSYARGEAGDESDLDVAIVGDGPHSRLEAHDGTLVSAAWASADEQRARLYEPHYLATHVAGWRTAVTLHDPGTARDVDRRRGARVVVESRRRPLRRMGGGDRDELRRGGAQGWRGARG